MNNGIIGKLRQNAKGVWYTFIKDGITGEDTYYKLKPGEESAFSEGVKVDFEKRAEQGGAGKPAAYNVRLPGTEILRAQAYRQTRNTAVHQTETDAEYYLPKDTSELLFKSSGVTIDDIADNTALKIRKYICAFHEPEKKFKILNKQVFSAAEKDLLARVTRSQLDAVSAYKYSHCVTGTLGSRMAVGLGGGSVFETAITLHHVYGFPYIPGSSVKGCLRGFIIRGLFGGEENNALADPDFIAIFGTQEQRGGVVFLDAFPVRDEKLALELDIMNPHYADYYQGKKPEPSDDMNPTPIKFYAVPKDIQFTFRLVSGKLAIKKAAVRGSLLTDLFKTTLSEIGLGAKTAVGYGWFGNIRER